MAKRILGIVLTLAVVVITVMAVVEKRSHVRSGGTVYPPGIPGADTIMLAPPDIIDDSL